MIMSAASTVFEIAELLQQIISELPPLDIIQYQRVNHTWQKLITGSPILQYKAWLRNDYPDPTQHASPDDLVPELSLSDPNYRYGSDAAAKYNHKRFLYNITKHLNPIIVTNILQDPPDDCRYCFDPIKNMATWGFGGYMSFRPVLLRALRQWYSAHKDSEVK